MILYLPPLACLSVSLMTINLKLIWPNLNFLSFRGNHFPFVTFSVVTTIHRHLDHAWAIFSSITFSIYFAIIYLYSNNLTMFSSDVFLNQICFSVYIILQINYSPFSENDSNLFQSVQNAVVKMICLPCTHRESLH